MRILAQLIKLQDYISRYEWNAYRYPSQFIRLKQDNWQKLNALWLKREEMTEIDIHTTEEISRSPKWKIWKKKEQVEELNVQDETSSLPNSKIELKQFFLDRLLQIQLKWATSTVTDLSFIDKSYASDPEIKYFLQRFPDTYLIMYYPIFNIKKAPVDGEIILISPIGVEIIYLMDEGIGTTIMAGDERTWTVTDEDEQRKVLNPHIPLKRTEQIVKSVLNYNKIDFPIQKTVLSKTNNIIFSEEPFQTKIIGRQQYEQWFQDKRTLSSPLKNRQLKVAEALLNHCQTTSVKRPEWEEEQTTFEFADDEL
ncbi:MAG: NERD domain-containing protein [Bacillota bacterium]|uniref:NERD domain-containing protein n=1 Tax=Virgibacillus TaxID=84406 RepID=UPI00041E99CB|nr:MULTISPECIES: NERD domain-containing protein [Bacillaceae]MCC2250098.1 NERD domain-containing protein [Virgibacillus sp. AGTR]MDY7046255.1 NERD domain-containing protein [Virgibacillus sp. M23]WBX78862.1 NERD domain-containing protein [Virgibacillus salarius]